MLCTTIAHFNEALLSSVLSTWLLAAGLGPEAVFFKKGGELPFAARHTKVCLQVLRAQVR